MKILIIQPWIKVGGSEVVSAYLAYYLAQQGYQTKVVALFTDFAGVSPKVRQVEYITPGEKIASLCQRSQLFFFLVGPLILFYLVFKNSDKKTILNPHNLPSYWVAALTGWLKKIPVVWLCSEPPVKVKRAEQGLLKTFAWFMAASPLDKLFVKMIDKIIVLSLKGQNEVKKRYGRKATIINSLPDFEFFSQGKGERIRQKYNLKEKFILLTVGKLYQLKNQALCLEALSLIKSEISEAVLFIAGKGAQEQALKKRSKELGLEEKVKFLGFVSTQELRDLYWAADINLFPALRQSWGLTPLEALCAQTISIVSDDSGIAELLKKEKIGIVCPAEPKAFAKQILQVYREKKRFKKMVRKGCVWMKKNLSWEEYARKSLKAMID